VYNVHAPPHSSQSQEDATSTRWSDEQCSARFLCGVTLPVQSCDEQNPGRKRCLYLRRVVHCRHLLSQHGPYKPRVH